MSIECPHCQHVMRIKDAKPGRYQPTCRKCGKRFLLLVPADPKQAPVARRLQPKTKDGATKVGAGQTSANKDGATDVPSAAASAPTSAAFDATMAADDRQSRRGAVEETLPPSGDATQAPGEETLPPSEAAGSSAAEVSGLDQTSLPGDRSERTLPPNDSATRREQASARSAAPPASANAASGVSGSAPAAAPVASAAGRVLGGYRLQNELGRGAMGAVYRARQLSLDRDVALKLIQEDLASDPRFIARFTREAYAAAQLNHHNVVQIYDLGSQDKTHFFSMELVDGQSLADLIEQAGKISPEAAVSYTLQAARGLAYAHDLGMVHRDVKPGNLLVNQQGVLKVADLGLVKTRGSREQDVRDAQSAEGRRLAAADARTTLRNVAMGTPAYMAPEQAASAADVDQRADIYSLGCTLYVLLTGRPPFEGTSAAEVITKHKSEPVARPDTIVQRIPGDLSDIVMKMVAKNPDERYPELQPVIRDLEGFLGIQESDRFRPGEEELARFEQSAEQYAGSMTAKLRGKVSLVFWGFCLLISLLGLATQSIGVVLTGLGVAALTPLCYQLLVGLRHRTFLFSKVRDLAFGSSLGDYLMAIVGGLLLVVGVVMLQLIGVAIAVVVISVGLAAAFHFVVDGRVTAERKEALTDIEDLLKRLRIRGVEEDQLRQFVARHSGNRWEELFEDLFGYEAKLEARSAWGANAKGQARPKHAAWRDRVIASIDARLQRRNEARQRRHLQKVQQAELQADGLSADQAKREAESRASAMIEQAAAMHAALAKAALEQDPKVAAARKRERMRAMMEAARGGKEPASTPRQGPGFIVGMLLFPFSGKMRFLVGALLLGVCAIWLFQNGLTAEGASGLVTVVMSGGGAYEPLQLPAVPETIARWLSGANVGLAGLILVLSAFILPGYRATLFLIPAALLMILGPHFGVPELLGLPPDVLCLGGGVVLTFLALLLGRRRSSA